MRPLYRQSINSLDTGRWRGVWSAREARIEAERHGAIPKRQGCRKKRRTRRLVRLGLRPANWIDNEARTALVALGCAASTDSARLPQTTAAFATEIRPVASHR